MQGKADPVRGPSTGVGAGGREVLGLASDGQRNNLAQATAAADLAPVLENPFRLTTAGASVEADDQRVHPLVVHVGAVDHGHAAGMDLRRHLVLRVENEQLAAGHAAADLVL